GVAERERREPGERLEDAGVASRERDAAPPADAEHALHLVAPPHRRDERVREALVRRRRHPLGELAVVAAGDRAPLADRDAGEPARRRELEPDERLVEAVQRRA